MKHTWDPRLFNAQTSPDLQPVETVYTNPWFMVRNRGGYYTVETQDSLCVGLPIVDNRAVVMVRVFRPLLNDATLEFPGGGFDPDQETPEQGIRREMAEETGIWIDDLDQFQPLPPLAVIPNRSPTLIFPFQVNLTQEAFDNRKAHDNEISEVLCLPFDQIISKIQNGEIYVAMPMAMVFRWLIKEGKITLT